MIGTIYCAGSTQDLQIHGTVYKNSAPILMARVAGNDGANLTQSDINTASYSIYLLDDSDPDSRTAVTGHSSASLTPANILFDSLQTDNLWGDRDSTGYNFKHQIDVSSNQAFTVAGRSYSVEYTLTPSSQQAILVRFKLTCE